MAVRALLATLAFLLMLAPSAGAHTTVKPKENEVHILSDAADDISYEVGSWDLWNIYVGEASIAGLGDGIYFHTILFGDFARKLPGETEFKAKFSFQGPAGAVSRTLSTKDGKTLTGDFDALEFKTIGTDFEVLRAFVSFAKAGLGPGMEVKGWKVETFVDAELRDVAPGGYFLPRSGGRVEKPETSSVRTPNYKLAGAGTYFKVTPSAGVDGVFGFGVVNSLKDTSQLVKLERTITRSWEVQPIGEAAAQLPGGKASVLQAKLVYRAGPSGLVEPGAFNITSDAGGRVGLVAHLVNGVPVVSPEGTPVAAGKIPAAPAEAPAFGAGWMVLALLGAALVLLRPRGRA